MGFANNNNNNDHFQLFCEFCQLALLVFVVGPFLLAAGALVLIARVLKHSLLLARTTRRFFNHNNGLQQQQHASYAPRSILITGSSSGIGRSLAIEYAKRYPGVFIALHGRDKEKLDEVKAICEASGATVNVGVIDVTDAERMRRWILEEISSPSLDLVIANAGVTEAALTEAGVVDYEEKLRKLFATNVDGVINTIFPAIKRMQQHKHACGRGVRGQIVLMSSLSSYIPDRGMYSAAKVSVRYLGETLRRELAPQGIKVNVIAPGFVDTPQTRKNKYDMPMIMDAETSSRIIMDGIERDLPVIAYPYMVATVSWIFSVLPSLIRERIKFLTAAVVAKKPKK